MSLSQDEINALLSGDEEEAAETEVEILSPEEIAAMLDDAVDADIITSDDVAEVTPSDTEAPAEVTAAEDADQDTSADALSAEEIAALLDSDDTVAGSDVEPGFIKDKEVAAESEQEDGGDSGIPDEVADIIDELVPVIESPEPEGKPTVIESSGVSVNPGALLEGEHSLDGMLTAQEIDIIGEIGNISMGAVATTMYTLLDRRVSITTPRVSIFQASKVLGVYETPFVVSSIEYVEGLDGRNLLVLKVEDSALITDLLLGGDGELEQPVELNELHLSAMSEIMNQMMGASSTALSKLFQRTVNISPPTSSQVDVGYDVCKVLGNVDLVTKISFDMEIEGLLRSELIQLVPYEISRELARVFIDDDKVVSPIKEKIATYPENAPAAASSFAASGTASAFASAVPVAGAAAAGAALGHNAGSQAAPPQPPADAPPAAPPYPPQTGNGQPPPPYPGAAYPVGQYPNAPYPPAPYPHAAYPHPSNAPYPQHPPSAGRVVDVHPVQFQPFDSPGASGEQKGIDLVYNIPLQVTVELGKTRKEISEILEFSTGTIVMLDKIAGDPVEIVVNGKLIARGEVVVIEENYGVRITGLISE